MRNITRNRHRTPISSESPEYPKEKSSIRIQFVNFLEYAGSISYPMGLLYVSAYLKEMGFTDIDYVDHMCMMREIAREKESKPKWSSATEGYERNLENLFSYLKETNPHLILIGPVTTKFLVDLIDLAPRIRDSDKDAIILAGGPHFGKNSSMDVELLQEHCEELDGGIVGDAEETVAGIAENVLSRFKNDGVMPTRKTFQEELKEIPGVQTRYNTLQPRDLSDLDNMPFPDMELLEEYWKHPKMPTYYEYTLSERRNPLVGRCEGVFQGDSDWGYTEDDIRYFDRFMVPYSRLPFGIVFGSRGCPYKCSFCCSSGPRRLHSASYVFDQMMELNKRFGIRLFVFFDPLFTMASKEEEERIRELCDMLIAEHTDLKYMIDIRADVIRKLPERLLVKMIQSGCAQFNLGLEKGSNRSLERITKGIRFKDHSAAIEKIRESARKAGTEVLLNGTFIFGGPAETKADIRDTLTHAFSLDLDEAVFYPLEIHPGTRTYEDALEEGILERGLMPYLNPTEYPLYATHDMPREYLLQMSKTGMFTFESLRELKNAIRKIVHQLEHGEGYSFPGPKGVVIGDSYKPFRKFITNAMELTRKHPKSEIVVDGETASILRSLDDDVGREIERLEDELRQRYPDYDPSIGDYYPRTLFDTWRRFLRQLSRLFKSENFI